MSRAALKELSQERCNTRPSASHLEEVLHGERVLKGDAQLPLGVGDAVVSCLVVGKEALMELLRGEDGREGERSSS
jgi:hypothetical protein